MEITEYIGLIKDIGISGITLLILLLYVRQRGRQDDYESAKDKAFIELIQSQAANIQASTTVLQSINTGMESAQKTMSAVTERHDSQFEKLQASIDKLPIDVKAALVDDFESIGNRLATLNKGVQEALTEWAKTGAKLQGLLSSEQQALSGTDTPITDLPTTEPPAAAA